MLCTELHGGSSWRRADVGLDSVNARYDRGCRETNAIIATILPLGTLNESCFYGKEETAISFDER